MLVGVASLIPTLRNIDILHYKLAKLPKHLQHSVSSSFSLVARWHNIFSLNSLSLL